VLVRIILEVWPLLLLQVQGGKNPLPCLGALGRVRFGRCFPSCVSLGNECLGQETRNPRINHNGTKLAKGPKPTNLKFQLARQSYYQLFGWEGPNSPQLVINRDNSETMYDDLIDKNNNENQEISGEVRTKRCTVRNKGDRLPRRQKKHNSAVSAFI